MMNNEPLIEFQFPKTVFRPEQGDSSKSTT